MKKLILSCMALMALVASLFFGCKKDSNDDNSTTTVNESPTITLKGNASVISILNAVYTDSGAIATDPEDGALVATSNLSLTNPNIDSAGTYTITYTATDSKGKTATRTRTIEVRNEAYMLAGTFNTTESPSGNAWQQTITPSLTKNNFIVFGEFANYTNNSAITAKISDVSGVKYLHINPSPQTANGIGTDGCNHRFIDGGLGTQLLLIGGKWTFSLKFTDEVLSGGAGCTATGAVPYEDTFTQN